MPDPFHIRFIIDVPIEEARRRFSNRIENTALAYASNIFSSVQGNPLNSLMLGIETAFGESHSQYISGPMSFIETWRRLVGGEFGRSMQAAEAFMATVLPKFPTFAKAFDQDVAGVVNQSEIDLGINWHSGFFSRKGAAVLDEKLVNESLRWLADPKYQNVLVPFQKGLSHLLEGESKSQRYGDAVTDMYEALEAIAKIVTGKPTRDLSALREEFVAKLRLPDTHKAMLKEYIDYGCDFRHAVQTSQTRTWPLEHEAENFVYMTGLFIRLAIQAQR